MWIDIGTPKVSFLVALDAGSDLFWVPCDCVQCAPLSSSFYSSLVCNTFSFNGPCVPKLVLIEFLTGNLLHESKQNSAAHI